MFTVDRDTERAMSEEDVEIVARIRRRFEAYSRGDFDAVMEWIHPEIELVPAGRQPPIRGAESYRAWLEPDAFESQVLEPLEIRLNGSKVLVHVSSTIRGAASGIEAEFLTWVVLTLDEAGFTRRLEIFLDHQEAEALEAAGLPE
jgi:ketosteroid isomerase-like protein